MIRVPLEILMVIYLTILLGALACIWISGVWISARRERRRRRDFVICKICDHIYEDRTTKELVQCPRCKALNERERVSEI